MSSGMKRRLVEAVNELSSEALREAIAQIHARDRSSKNLDPVVVVSIAESLALLSQTKPENLYPIVRIAVIHAAAFRWAGLPISLDQLR